MKPFRMKNYLLAQFNKDKQGHTTFHRYCVAVFNDYLSICAGANIEPMHPAIEGFMGQEVNENGDWIVQFKPTPPCYSCDMQHSQ